MDSAKQQLVERLKTANNVLVTVSRNPSVDQLASCIGLSLLLNKQGKHAAAVFSGQVPSTLEFLQPEETLEKTTDSLRDFIISLDKSKADKLRYKVEDNIVRIFITPYKTSITQEDLEFSEGDFNVDVVVALGVHEQEDLDEAITAHGRILHDATVASLNTTADGGLGSINWYDPQASSLSELVTELAQALSPDILDNQIATALLTGIVSETNRFSNDKTSSQTMSASAALMSAGANQQLVASKLQEGGEVSAKPPEDKDTLSIDHGATDDQPLQQDQEQKQDLTKDFKLPEGSKIAADGMPPMEETPIASDSAVSPGAKLMTEPPTLGGKLTANSQEEPLDPTSDPLSLPSAEQPQLLDHKLTENVSAQPPMMAPPPPAWTPPQPSTDNTPPPPTPDATKTLTDLEAAVNSPHTQAEEVDTARDQVDQALRNVSMDDTQTPEPIQSLNAQPLGENLHIDAEGNPSTRHPEPPVPPSDTTQSEPPSVNDPTAPPPVPPPIPFDFNQPQPPAGP